MALSSANIFIFSALFFSQQNSAPGREDAMVGVVMVGDGGHLFSVQREECFLSLSFSFHKNDGKGWAHIDKVIGQ